jgi:hypothetical protein
MIETSSIYLAFRVTGARFARWHSEALAPVAGVLSGAGGSARGIAIEACESRRSSKSDVCSLSALNTLGVPRSDVTPQECEAISL